MAKAAQQPQQAPAQAQQQALQEKKNGFDSSSWLDEQMKREISYKPLYSETEITLSAKAVLRYLCRPTKNGKYPTEQDAVRFIRLCVNRQLDPWQGDAFLVGFDGKDGPEFNLITSEQAFLKRAEANTQYDGKSAGLVIKIKGVLSEVEGTIVPDGAELVGGWCRVYRKDRGRPEYKQLKLSTYNTGRSRWNVDPTGMIIKCATSQALRHTFPNNCGGMYLAGEFDHVIDGPADPAKTKSTADRVSRFKGPANPTTTMENEAPEEPKDPEPTKQEPKQESNGRPQFETGNPDDDPFSGDSHTGELYDNSEPDKLPD